MIENILKNKYTDKLSALDIYETKTSLILSRIIINPDIRSTGIGTSVMEDLIKYADNHEQIVALTPSSDFGGNINRLIQFYKMFGFKMNKGYNKNFEYRETMIRNPKTAGMKENTKETIKKLLRESLLISKTPESLNERILTKKEKDIKSITDFVNFAKDELGIDDDIKVALAYERTPDITTTAYYNLNGFIKIYVKDRAIIDVLRSVCHELVHHKQNLEGRLTNPAEDGADGSDIENEANSIAGVLVRRYGKLYPELYI